ncbi:SAM-dependent methyltransferase [Streptomyces rapamycinicus]|nr:SAM-dependent methyltransferase [Streptomyces rapamycinicus]MBB4782251.1 SAM-dependent methyltransferase [Streptomyces rapamycinicus]UTO62779.1 SAM-dependent methyltransferase [Streptomyces rapamycinicus]UTP30737.1 SAM-dependent methyltransferase [Streptomyces rapamycinicus NRRL 5491]
MTSTLVRRHRPRPSSSWTTDAPARTRDWAEIQERMLVPLYEAVYERLDVGAGTRLLGLGCGSGLALLIAAARGAAVCGVDKDERRLDLARERLTAAGAPGDPARPARLGLGGPESPCVREAAADADFTVVTAFEPLSALGAGSPGATVAAAASTLVAAAAGTERGGAVVLAGWGPPERCATSGVLRVGARLADPMCAPGYHGEVPPPARWQLCGRDDLEELAARAGLRPDGSGRVACPFGYADMDSAVRGLLSTGLFDAAERATDPIQVRKEITEALHPHQRADGTVWMPNVFRYLICRV